MVIEKITKYFSVGVNEDVRENRERNERRPRERVSIDDRESIQ